MKNPSEGGCYEMRDGKRVRVEQATVDHPAGNRPRDNKGKPIGKDVRPDPEAASVETPAPANPKPPKGGSK